MRILVVLCAALVFASCGGDKPKPNQVTEQIPPPAPAPSVPGEVETKVEMVNVNLHMDPELTLQVRRLNGKFLSTRKGQPPAFDDQLSYIVAVDSAEIAISTASMTHVMNTYVFGEPDAPLKNLKLSIQGNQVKQTGTLQKGPGVPFEMIGDMSATPDGKIRIHPTQLKAEHVPVKGLMKLFGLDMAKLINTRNTRGIAVDDNDVILDPAQMLPPPKMRGRVTSVRIEGDNIVQIFGNQPVAAAKASKSNYMWYLGGVLRFGKLTMNDTDMQLIDADPSDPFDFYPEHYKDMLVAGYSKTTVSGGLKVYMPDYNKVGKPLKPR